MFCNVAMFLLNHHADTAPLLEASWSVYKTLVYAMLPRLFTAAVHEAVQLLPYACVAHSRDLLG